MTMQQSHQPSQDAMRPAESVARELGLPLYRLRSWESLYPVFTTVQQSDGQRYYDRQAVNVVSNIARLLYQEGARSHEIVPLLKREGIIGGEEDPASEQEASPVEAQVAPVAGNVPTEMTEALERKLEQLEREKSQLEDRLEEFGHIALSLKTLEDENGSLKEALAQARSASSGQEGHAAYVKELEENSLILQESVERLTDELEGRQDQEERIAALREELAGMAGAREELQTLKEELSSLQGEVERCRTLEAENRALREAESKRGEAADRQAAEELARLQQAVAEKDSALAECKRMLAARDDQKAVLESLKEELAEAEAVRPRVRELEGELRSARAAAGRCETLEAENRSLREAHQKAQGEGTKQANEWQTRLETVEGERRTLVQKLEQSVLAMRSLEDENVRFKRSLKEQEAARKAQDELAGRVQALERENESLKREQANLAGERELHTRGQERTRVLETENVALRQELQGREEALRAREARQEGFRTLLNELLEELDRMKKTLAG